MWLWVAVAVAALCVAALLTLSRRPREAQRDASVVKVMRWVPSTVATRKTGRSYLVIGGHGFVGSHIVEALLARGERDIWVFDAAPSPLFEDEGQKVCFVRGDIMNKHVLLNACYGRDVVFHTAATLNYWSRLEHDKDRIYQINYLGTKNVIEACRTASVKKLIFTSSASIFLGADRKPISQQREHTLMFPEEPLCHYTHTKMLAEKLVLASNGYSGVLTAALRPNGIYGPRDSLIGRLAAAGEPGIGTKNGEKVDMIYVENLVYGMLKLEEKLVPGSPVAGKAFFISDDEPISNYDFNMKIYKEFGREYKTIPLYIQVVLAHTIESITWITRGRVPLGSLMHLTPPTLALTHTEFHFSIEKAKKELDYKPLFTLDEAIKKTAQYFKALEEAQRINEHQNEESRKDK